MGIVLIIAGIVQVFWQMVKIPTTRKDNVASQSVTAAPHKFELKSAYPGISMMGLGCMLLLAALYFGQK
jgi:hypothetical protein